MPKPSITIVTPSFNDAAFLAAAITSVVSQGYPNLEYVVVDGGSTDGSVEILRANEGALARWVSEPDSGQYDALQKGFESSSGEIMGWLNANDLYFPWALDTVASIMSTLPEVRWISTLNPATWDVQGRCIRVTPLSGFSWAAFLDGRFAPWERRSGSAWIQQESTFWRRALWDEAGGKVDRGLRLAGDFELWTRFYDHAELYGTPALLGGYREHERGPSRVHDPYAAEAGTALEAMRTRAGWQPSRRRRLDEQLQRLPKLRPGYIAHNVVCKEPASSEPRWAVETARFRGGPGASPSP
jgi:hypothetical protein